MCVVAIMDRFYVVFLLIGTVCAVPGGWNEVYVDDGGVQDAANFGAVEIDSRSNSLFKSRLLSVLKAESQVNFSPFGMALNFKVAVCIVDSMSIDDAAVLQLSQQQQQQQVLKVI